MNRRRVSGDFSFGHWKTSRIDRRVGDSRSITARLKDCESAASYILIVAIRSMRQGASQCDMRRIDERLPRSVFGSKLGRSGRSLG